MNFISHGIRCNTKSKRGVGEGGLFVLLTLTQTHSSSNEGVFNNSRFICDLKMGYQGEGRIYADVLLSYGIIRLPILLETCCYNNIS